MLQLYLRGFSTHDIRDVEAFRGFTAGAVVQARVSGRWDEAREEYWERVRRSTIDQAVHLGEETTRTIFGLVSCANLHLTKRVSAYLAGETKELPIEVDKVVHYKQLVDLYLVSINPRPPKVGEDTKQPDDSTDDLSDLPRDQQLRVLASKQRQLGVHKPFVES